MARKAAEPGKRRAAHKKDTGGASQIGETASAELAGGGKEAGAVLPRADAMSVSIEQVMIVARGIIDLGLAKEFAEACGQRNLRMSASPDLVEFTREFITVHGDDAAVRSRGLRADAESRFSTAARKMAAKPIDVVTGCT